jgi:putative polymerase
MRPSAEMAQMNAVTGWQGETDYDAPQGDGTIYAVIAAAILENPILALVNNFAVTLNAQVVAAVQLLITFAAVVVIVLRRPKLSHTFVVAGCLFLCCTLLKFIVSGTFNPRFLYDAAMLPLFLVLGASARGFSPRFFTIILVALVVTAVVELVFPDFYAALFNPRKYFYFTRDWVAAVTAPDASIATSSDIYLGSNRYTGSFFGMSHRAGSLFLEPLSVGYFGIIGAIFLVHTPGLTIRRRSLLIFGCLMLAVLSDTRVAVFLILAAIVLRHVAGRVQLRWLFAVPYGVLLAVVILSFTVQAMPGDLGLRLGVTAEPLLDASPLAILFGGVSDAKVADSGIVYLIANAGLIGFCLYPLLASGILRDGGERSPVAVSILLYLLVALVFGYAPMSIKTESVLGYGVATLSRPRQDGFTPAPGALPLPCSR